MKWASNSSKNLPTTYSLAENDPGFTFFTDALDSNSNKKALSEADKVLKKHPQFLAAKALKALAILRLGRDDESKSILDAIMKEKPVDDGTLQVLTFCFKEMEQCT